MRFMVKGLFAALLVLLTVGPLTAAPLSLTAGAHFTAPSATRSHASIGSIVGYVLGVTALGITIKKDAGTIAQKYVTRASAAAPDYKSGVTGTGGSWENAAKNGEGNWESGVTDAVGRKAFSKGVTGKGQKFEANASGVGAQRYPQGVQNAGGAYTSGIQPVLDKLKSIQLPPKGPRRSPQNQQRAQIVASELGKLKAGH